MKKKKEKNRSSRTGMCFVASRETYYRVDFVGNVFCEIDKRASIDNVLYDTLNYFRTRDQAEEAARRVKETLRKYHEETGE